MTLRLLSILALYVVFLTFKVTAAEKGRSTLHQLTVDGAERSYIAYRPASAGDEKLPLMLVLHGGLGNAEAMEKRTGMNTVADSGPFMVAYPNGLPVRKALMGKKMRRLWNAGACCGLSVKKRVDDVRFIEKVIGDIQSKYAIDPDRIYATGLSNGAMMAYRLACEMPRRIAAIIPIAGTLAVDNCDAAREIPVMHIHGTADSHVPVEGGMGDLSIAGVSHRSLADTVTLLTRARRCDAPEVTVGADGVEVSSYRCHNGAPVKVVLLRGGEHAWPGGHSRRDKDSAGRRFSASEKAWEFAKQFSKTSK